MEKKNSLTAAAIALLVIAALVVWYLPTGPETGSSGHHFITGEWISPWDLADSAEARQSASEWLATGKGTQRFPGGEAGEPVPVFEEYGGSLFSWIIPVKSGGTFTGYMIAYSDSFDYPDSYTVYGEPQDMFINRRTSADIEAVFILSQSGYSGEEIMEPYVIIRDDGGYSWVSEVVRNGQVIDRMFSTIEMQ